MMMSSLSSVMSAIKGFTFTVWIPQLNKFLRTPSIARNAFKRRRKKKKGLKRK